ncbi:MAG: Lrp/AsnC family transcriptional regulator [Flammeovirgaceae bacterium]
MIQLDTTDKAIVKRLLENSRISFVKLAKELGISNTMVHKRVNNLRKVGLLKKATFQVDPKVLGYTTEAYTRIKVANPKQIKPIIQKLKQIPEVVSCSNITGQYALIIRIYAKDNSALRSILYNQIHPIDGVASTDTIISFETSFEKFGLFS